MEVLRNALLRDQSSTPDIVSFAAPSFLKVSTELHSVQLQQTNKKLMITITQENIHGRDPVAERTKNTRGDILPLHQFFPRH
uniref:Uncharacterized protein n=1 Tax=Physcomitrium patens TaxID=3218 RepID=A0A2K1KKC8_PHYPA|nr:hypothetical protein PHYPA_007921 [Physcomitrium patens]